MEINMNSNQTPPQSTPVTPTQNSKESFGAVQQNTPKQEKPRVKGGRKSQLTSLALVVLLLVSGLGMQKVYLKNKLSQELVEAEALVEAQKTNKTIKDNKEVSLALKNAFLEKQRDEQIFWSNVLVRFNDLMKLNRQVGNSSFSGNQQGNLAFSAKTKSASNDPYLDTALLIEKFKASASFDGIFIPSISSTVSESGEETLSYNVRVDYLKNEIDQDLIEDINTEESEDIQVDEDAVNELADSLRTQADSTGDGLDEELETTTETAVSDNNEITTSEADTAENPVPES